MLCRIFNAILRYSRSQIPVRAASEWVSFGEMTDEFACICICGQPHKWMNVWRNVITGKQVPVGRVCSKNLSDEIERVLEYEDHNPDSRHVRAGYRRDDFVVEDDEVKYESDYEPSEEDIDEDSYADQDDKEEQEHSLSDFKEIADDSDIDAYDWECKEVVEANREQSFVIWWPVVCSLSMYLKLRIRFNSEIDHVLEFPNNKVGLYWRSCLIDNENIS